MLASAEQSVLLPESWSANSQPLSILLLAPPTLLRLGLRAALLAARPSLEVLEPADLSQLLILLQQRPRHLVVLDTALPGPPARALIEQVRAVCPRQRLLVLAGSRAPLSLRRYLVELGAGALLSHRSSPAKLLAAVEHLLHPFGALREELQQPPVVSRRPRPLAVLTRREQEVLHLLADDLSNVEIADRLCLSVRTVESHRRTLLQKTGTRSPVGLVLAAVRQGWLQIN